MEINLVIGIFVLFFFLLMILLNVVAKHMYGLKKNSINVRVDYLY